MTDGDVSTLERHDDTTIEVARGEDLVSTDKSCIDVASVHAILASTYQQPRVG